MIRFIFLALFATKLFSTTLEDKISSLFIIGFNGEKAPKSIIEYIKKRELGGVILFSKNIKDPIQLKKLTSTLKNNSKSKLFIGVDEEGGLVQRLNSKNGFFDTPKAVDIPKLGQIKARSFYKKMAKMLHNEGINLNFAPVVDLALNKNNQVIYKYGRSFGSDPKVVEKYATIFIDQMKKEGVVSVLKHFPGHGSSTKDSHKGFVDVTNLYKKIELEPFLNIDANIIMTAHIFNKNIDPNYPATLSKKSIDILRSHGFDGVILSDDLQMGAIRKNYDLNQTLSLAINSGVNMLLFGNQLSKPIDIRTLVNRVKILVNSGKIDIKNIEKSYKRVKRLKEENL